MSDAPISARGLRLPWPAVVVIVGALLGGAGWATKMQSDVSGLQAAQGASDRRLDRIERNLIRLLLKAGVEPVEDGR